MIRYTLSILVLLSVFFIGTIQCAPTSPKRDTLSIKRVDDGVCGSSSFYGYTTSTSAKIADCQELVSKIGGITWEVGSNPAQLFESGTCKVTAYSIGAYPAYIGGRDVQDLIQDSINKFGQGGRVAGQGLMNCQGPAGNSDVVWMVYRA